MSKSKADKEQFDIHRTLPSRQAAGHSLKGRNMPLDEIEQLPAGRRGWKFSFKKSLAALMAMLLIFVITTGIWDAVSLSRASQKMFGSGNLFSLLLGRDLSNHKGRTNILMVGYSIDDPGHEGASLTDSIMLISMDRHSKTGYMLSVPRDLWVKIPGYGHAKINEAYQDGNRDDFSEAGYPNGGMGLLEKVISENFGVPIDYYALVDYAAFRDTVNAVGGITINIQSNDPRGIYDPSLDYTSATCCALANYPNGPVTLNGHQALDLARARGGEEGNGSYGFGQADFDRTAHQRQMLIALKQKASSWSVIINPLKAGHIFDGMANNVKTDIGVSNVLPLFSLSNKISVNNLKSLGLRDLNGQNLLAGYGGALIPAAGIDDFSDIQSALSQLNQ